MKSADPRASREANGQSVNQPCPPQPQVFAALTAKAEAQATKVRGIGQETRWSGGRTFGSDTVRRRLPG